MSYDLCLHVDANDPAVLAFAFVNARNYMNGLPGKEFELVLVANGPAVKLFVPAQAEPGGDRGAAEQGLRLHQTVIPPFFPLPADLFGQRTSPRSEKS